MTDCKFLEICKNVIKPLLDHITKDDHIKVIYDISEESKALNVKSHYDRIRDGIKRDFMHQPEGRIDRHKICACMYAAITTKPECRNSDSSETYLTQTLKELCYAQKHNEMSILMLANIFSTIESYNES